MRTTIDIPDDLLRRAKATAALRGMKLKELMARCLEDGLRRSVAPEAPAQRRVREFPSWIPETMTGEPIRALTNAEVEEMFLQEDIERLGRR